MTAPAQATMPTGNRCPIGPLNPLNLHTYNHERDQCIWCGPGPLAWKPGKWVPLDGGGFAWSVEPEPAKAGAS